MMLHCRKYVQFIFQMTAINFINKWHLSTGPWLSRDGSVA